MDKLVINAFIAVEESSKWSKDTFSKDEIDSLNLDQLRKYAFEVSCRFTHLGYELSRVSESYKTISKYNYFE